METLTLPEPAATPRHYTRIFRGLAAGRYSLPMNDVWVAAATVECTAIC